MCVPPAVIMVAPPAVIMVAPPAVILSAAKDLHVFFRRSQRQVQILRSAQDDGGGGATLTMTAMGHSG